MRLIAIIVLALASSASFGAEAVPGSGPFIVDELLEGVWLFRVPANSPTHTNSVVIQRDHGLLVVESQPSPEAARELIAAIREVSPDPIRYLVLGHAHVESAGGATAFPETALVIATLPTHEVLQNEELDLGAESRLRSPDPDAWIAPPRVRPGLVVGGVTILNDGPHTIELLGVARGHCPGAIVVRIAEHDLYYVGAMATADGNPFADPENSNVEGWVAWINSLLVSKPGTLIPMRGEPFDTTRLRAFRDALAFVIGRVQYGLVERLPREEIPGFVMDAPEFKEHFDVDAKPFLAPTLIDQLLRKKRR